MYVKKKYWIAVICRLVLVLTSFLATIFINRGLGVTGKGDYAYIINMSELLYIFCSVGLGPSYSTFKRNSLEDVKKIFTALGLIHFFGVLLIGFIVINILNISFGLQLVILTALSTVRIVIIMIAVVENSIKRNIILSICGCINTLTLGICYYYGILNLTVAFCIYGFNILLCSTAICYYFKLKPSLHSLSLYHLRDIYKVGLITMLVGLLISINYSIDTVMLKWLTSSYYVGLYSVGVNFSNMFLMIPDSFKEVLFGDAAKQDFKKDIVYSAIKISVICAILFAFCFILLGKQFIILFYGVAYSQAYEITNLLFLGSISLIFFKILQPVFIAHGGQSKAAIFLLLSAIINIIANFILIPQFNAVGAAIASLISYFICGGIFLVDFIKNFK